MAYNKQHNTRFSGRYNTPGQFVSGGELAGPTAPGGGYTPRLTRPSGRPSPAYTQQPRKQMTSNLQPILPNDDDVPMAATEEMDQSVMSEDGPPRPYWMKNRLAGVKKISNKERRRRQNENLRRLLTPKNALMVLNEMMPNDQVANQFKVEPAPCNTFKPANTPTFCADLTIEGSIYKGYGDNKLMARNAAAEQAIRDLIIKKMGKTVNSDSGSANGTETSDEETLPMIQLASFALHKLFAEWEYEGHSVPQLKPTNQSGAESASEAGAGAGAAPGARRPKELPPNARALHPCMLLTHMRPNLEYREVSVGGDVAGGRQLVFTMCVEVDGVTYVGKGPNKKEGRKQAAKAACMAIFDITFDEDVEKPPAAK